MKRFWKFFVVIACTGLVMIAAVMACDKPPEDFLQNVDKLSGKVEATLKDGRTVTFNFNDVPVETINKLFSKKAIGKPSLEPGDRVIIEIGEDGKVIRVKTPDAEVQGTIKAIDRIKKTVTIVTTDNQIIEVKVGDSAALSTLREGQSVKVKYNVKTIQGTPLYTLSTRCTPPKGGSVEPSAGAWKAGTQVTIWAKPDSGYKFDG